MNRTLRWHCDQDGIVFTCLDGDTPVPLTEWAASPVLIRAKEQAQPGLLLVMRDQDGVETVENGHALRVSAERIAAMEPWQARAVGLPPPPPYRLKLDRKGLFTDRDFSLNYYFVTPGGR